MRAPKTTNPPMDLDIFKNNTVEDLDGCLLWTGKVTSKGYPMYWAENTKDSSGRVQRWVLRELKGIDVQPNERWFLSCRNQLCLRPEHFMKSSELPTCKNGHEFTSGNTRMRKNGKRECRQCDADWMRRGNYGLEPEDYDRMLSEQDYQCSICAKEFGQNGKDTHVDHDHATGRVRALLCGRCNVMLGMAGDNIEVMTRAIEYLREHSEES